MTARLALSRIGHAVLSLLLLTIFIFGVVRITGDPTFVLLPEHATEEELQSLRERLGLTKPIWEQYVIFLQGLTEGDLGTSYRFKVPVLDLIQQRFPMTVQLAGAALVLVLVIGIPLGVYSAYWKGGRLDRFARGFAVLGQAAPGFWIGLMLIFVVAVWLHLLPPGGYGGPEHLLLPAFTIAWAAIAGLVRLIRSSMLETLDSDYVMFHRIKGVPERTVLWKHALRNAGLTSLTYVGIITAGLLTGSVLTETVFVWPGVGKLMVDAIQFRDFNVVLGVMLLFSTIYIAVNLLVDVSYVLLNPRLRGS
jgi:peptide/nickel transport system permease protein